jgi:hypothetical protein
MSTEPAPDGWEAMATMPCPVCGKTVPRGAFCGLCGAHLIRTRGDGPDWLRIRAYGAAPAEHLLRLSLVSSLFPQLPHSSRRAFHVGLAAVILALVVFALLRWQPPLIAISALGLPLLFPIYLHESCVFDDLPVRTLLITAVLGGGLGVGWASLTGTVVTRERARPRLGCTVAVSELRPCRSRHGVLPELRGRCQRSSRSSRNVRCLARPLHTDTKPERP